METKKFSTVESIKFGFYTVIENVLFFLALWLICFGVLFAGLFLATFISYFPFLNTIFAFLRENNSTVMNYLAVPHNYLQLDIRTSSALLFSTLFFGLLLKLLYRYLSLGIIRIALDFYDYQTSSLRQLFSGMPYLFKAFIAGILYNMMVTIGMVFFIIPGIYFLIKYGFYEQLIVDKNVGIFESFRQSAEITQGSKWHIFGLLFIFWCINITACFFCCLGLLVTYPALVLAQIYVYRKLSAVPMVPQKTN